MDDTTTPAAGANSAARDEGFATVSAAVAELERREKARAAEKRAARAAKEGDDAEGKAKEGDEDVEDDAGERDTKRPGEKRAKVAAKDDAGDGEADDDSDDQDAEDDEDEEAPRKRRAADDSEDDDGDDDSDADSEDDEPEPKDKPPAKIKLKIAGREVEATPDEVSQHVERSNNEVQQIRRFAVEAKQHFDSQAAELRQQAQMLQQVATHLLGQPPDNALIQSAPQEYLAQEAAYKQRMQLVQALQNLNQQHAQRTDAEQQQARSALKQQQVAALLRAMPELADPTKLAAYQGRFSKVAQKYGFSAQEAENMLDHRMYIMVRDLGRLADMDESAARNREKVREKLRNAEPLKSPKSGAVARPRDTQESRAKEAKRAFMKSGKTMRDLRRYVERTSPD